MKKTLALILLLMAAPLWAQGLTLTWTDNADNEDGFRVERKCVPEPVFSPLISLGINAESHLDQTAPLDIFCTYRVLAFNTVGDSAWSNEASGTAVPETPPPAPSFLSCDIQEVTPPLGDPSLVLALGFNAGTGTTAADSSANGNGGTLNNPAWTTVAQYGQALDFDGTDDRVELGTVSVSGSALTLLAWVRSENLGNCAGSNDCRIMTRATGTAEQDHDFMLSTIAGGPGTVLRFRLKTGGTTSTLIASSGPLSVNTWHHAAAVYDGATMALYLDGVQVGSQGKAGALTVTPGVQTWIGASPPSAAVPWRGQLDEVQIFSRALSQAEIQQARDTPIQ